MSYYNRFGNTYEQGMLAIAARRLAIVGQITRHKPDNLDELFEANAQDDYAIELDWVKVPDPRHKEGAPEIEVRPWLLVERFGDDEVVDITGLMLVGKLPSGQEQVIGIMRMPDDEAGLESRLDIYAGDNLPFPTRWDSADAELFLQVAETAMSQQSVS